MVSTRTPTKTWVAREGTVYLNKAANITISNTDTLSGIFADSTDAVSIEAACKNITITPPETSWEKQDLLGKDSDNFQNQLLDEKPVGTATFQGTLLVGEDETIEDFVVSGTAGGGSPAGYTRYQVGSGEAPEVAICVTLNSNDGVAMVSFVLDNARVTKWGDVRISGPDSHWEQDVTVMCLAKDYYYEFKD